MTIQRLDPAKWRAAYGIRIQSVYPRQGVVEPPFGAAWAVLAPGQQTKHHAHHDAETFFVAKGRGILRVGEESYDVRAGDVVYQAPFRSHTLTNTDEAEELLFLSVWWEDLRLLARAEPSSTPRRPSRVMVTAAPPTPNGDLHMGHLSGPYLAGDIYARYSRLRGASVHYVSGSDDNQSYVKTNAARAGIAPQASADLFSSDIAATLKAASIELDAFVRPNASPHHGPTAQSIFRRWLDAGHLIERETDSPWCESCKRYLHEAHISGLCPHCHSPSGGNGCEDCGRPNDCVELREAHCTACGGRPVRRRFKRLFFPLSRWEKPLRDFHERVAMNASLRALCEQIMAAGLPDVAVTHVSDWGIPVPVEGYEDQRIFVWCEMAARYLTYPRHLASADDDGESEDARIVQCFGFDNGFNYAIFLPALYLALDPNAKLPSAFLMNEFYHLDGRKFSTSRRHVIGGRTLLAQVPADLVRFYLSYTRPETESTNFTRADFDATCNRELLGVWQPWLLDLGTRIRTDWEGVVPATGDWTPEQRTFFEHLCDLSKIAAAAYEVHGFSPRRAARVLCDLARDARQFGKAEAVWQRVPNRAEERRTAMALELLAAKLLAVLSAPILPDFAARLWRELGYRTPLAEHRWEEVPEWVPAGQKISGLNTVYFSEIATDGAHVDRHRHR